MCDEAHFDNDVQTWTRREIGVLASAAGLASLWPLSGCSGTTSRPTSGPPDGAATGTTTAAPPTARPTTLHEVHIPTPDGVCDACLVAPMGQAGPAVLIWPDIFGLRPAFRQMAQRLAGAGYAVLVVNPFYRQGPAPTAPQGAATPIASLMPMKRALTAGTTATDTRALVAWLDARPEVDRTRPMGVMGYCMGGPMAVRSAATLPQRVGAVASFHGGGLVTPDADSPHRLVAGTRAHYLVAVAANDDAREPEAKVTLHQTLVTAQRPAEVEVYPAAHGWCPPDALVHDPVQAERAWQRLLVLLGQALV